MGKRGMQPRPASPAVVALAKEREGDFLEKIMPAVERGVRNSFWDKGREEREELVQDARCQAWQSFVSQIGKGKEPLSCVGCTVKYLVLGLRCGRRFCGQEPKRVPCVSYGGTEPKALVA